MIWLNALWITGGMSRRRIRLSREAILIHNWLCLNSDVNGALFNIDAFKRWFESEIGESLQTTQILSAIDELEEYNLIQILGWQIQPRQMDLEKFHPGLWESEKSGGDWLRYSNVKLLVVSRSSPVSSNGYWYSHPWFWYLAWVESTGDNSSRI